MKAIIIIAVLSLLGNTHAIGEEHAGRLVKFDFVALNARGEPVTDLEKGECQVIEDGRRESLSILHHQGTPVSEQQPPGRREYSNRQGSTPHPTIIVLDRLNERLLTWAMAGNQLVKAIEGLESGEDLYLYILTGKGMLYPIHAVPKTEADIQQSSGDWSKQIRPLVERASRQFAGFRPAEDQDPIFRASLTFNALGELASHLAAIPGRKNLVWISHGVPINPLDINGNPIDLTSQVRQFSSGLVAAGVAAYTVAQSGSGAGANVGSSGWEMLRLVSDLTGGRNYPSGNADTAINEARADQRASYMTGYYSRRPLPDGKFHKTRVTCARKGIRVQARQGYWDVPDAGTAEDREEAAFGAASRSPFDQTGIGLGALASALESGPSSMRLRIRVDPSDVVGPAQLVFAIVTYSADGSAQKHLLAVGNQMEITQDVVVDPSIEKLRIVVFDRVSRDLGSVTIPMRN